MKITCYCGKPAIIKVGKTEMIVCKEHAQTYIRGYKLMQRILNTRYATN